MQLPDGRTQVVKYIPINIFLKLTIILTWNRNYFTFLFFPFIRYTADSNGYKAEVSYIDGHQESISPVAIPQASPSPIPVVKQLHETQPVYNYYKNPTPHEYVDSYQNVQYQQHHPPTSATYYSNTAVPRYDHINVDNIKIDTYNTAPFHHSEANILNSAASPVIGSSAASIIGPTHESVFPTSSTPTYRNVYILPSPRTINNAYSTSGPSAYVNSSPANNYDYYVDYEYKTTHPTPKASQASILNTNALFYKSRWVKGK